MNNITLIKSIVGSQAYGTNTPNSDIDVKGVYLQNPMEVLGFDYEEQINISKDETFYEIRRFLQLACSGNPTMLELLFIPEDCILEQHPLWNIIKASRNKFLTKQCYNSLAGYATDQIQKAKGLNKKMNWDKNRVQRKRPIDFLKVIDGYKTYPLTIWLKAQDKLEDCCGLSKVNNSENIFVLYYDYIKDSLKDKDLSNPRYKDWVDFGYKGICNDTNLLLSAIPNYQSNNYCCYLYFNHNGWKEYCKDYNSYQIWLQERNVNRYIDTEKHGQQIDGKNLMHCMRLIQQAEDIVKHNTINVRVLNPEYFLSIRYGKICLEELINIANNKLLELKTLFDNSNLPNCVNQEEISELLLNIRKKSLNLF